MEALLVLPSRKTLEAAEAARADVCFELAIGVTSFRGEYTPYIENKNSISK